jgi:hypothetical protein
VRLYENQGLSLPLQSGGKEQSDSDGKEQLTLQSDSEYEEYWTLTLCSNFVEIFPKCFMGNCLKVVFWKDSKAR